MKLHLGCGNKYIPGFIHIDLMDFEHIDHKRSIDDLSIFEDSSVDLIYACHVLEHFNRNNVDKVLAEWCRVLKPGGIVRISVPGFEELVKIYQKYGDMKLILGPLVGGQTYLYNFHNLIFDFKFISELLKKAGFREVSRYDWRKTEHVNVDDFSQAYIPHMDKENGMPVSLNVEAVK
jgi:predicted SAM-dependent methyltransferase